MRQDVIVGTVNERAIMIGNYDFPMIVTTVEQKDFGEDTRALEGVVADLFRVPAYRVMPFERWKVIGQRLRENKFELFNPNSYAAPYAPNRDWHRDLIETLSSYVDENNNISTFAENSLKALLNQGMLDSAGSVALATDLWVSASLPPLPLNWIRRYVSKEEPKFSERELLEWLKITNLLLAGRENLLRQELSDLKLYGIPFGKSPDIDWKRIADLLKDPRNLCWFPLTYAAFTASTNHLLHGQFWLGLQVVVGGGVYTLVVFGFTSIVEHLKRKF